MDLREASLGFYRVWIGAVGARHGLWKAFDKPRDADAVAREHKLDPAILARWCAAAGALGLLEARGARWVVPRALRARLDPTHVDDLSQQFQYLAAKSLTFDALDDLLRGQARSPDLSKVYALATGWDHRAFFERALDARAKKALTRGIDVLDLGAGLGGWTREARERFPRSRFTMADVQASKDVVAIRDVPDASFDLVYMGEVLAAGGPTALDSALRALRPGGLLRAVEGLVPTRAPRLWGEKLVVAMNFDFALDGSRFWSVDEATAALRAANFVRPEVRDVGGSLFVLRAQKRQTRAAR